MDSTSLSADKLEIACVSRKDNELEYKILDNAHIDKVLQELDLTQPAESS